jgi:hypothetical protein
MPIVSEALCPTCNSPSPLRVLWDFARSSSYGQVGRFGTLTGHVGIACPACGTKLAVVQTRIRIFLVTTWAALMLAAAFFGLWLRARHVVIDQWIKLVALAVIYAAVLLLQRRLVPRLTQVRSMRSGEQLGFPLSVAYEGPIDSLLDPPVVASNQRLERP